MNGKGCYVADAEFSFLLAFSLHGALGEPNFLCQKSPNNSNIDEIKQYDFSSRWGIIKIMGGTTLWGNINGSIKELFHIEKNCNWFYFVTFGVKSTGLEFEYNQRLSPHYKASKWKRKWVKPQELANIWWRHHSVTFTSSHMEKLGLRGS